MQRPYCWKRSLQQQRAALDELQPDEKRQRAEEEDEDDELTLPPNEWGRTTFVREETRDSNRRSVPIRHDAPQLPMKDGTSDGYMTHPRHGIAGNVQRWARGSRDRFKEWLLHFDSNRFNAWAGHSDNATHFKSGKMFHYWSNRSTDVDFLKMVWINFGCPGHGKGPWDGFGAVV